jgi:hypothetical protein
LAAILVALIRTDGVTSPHARRFLTGGPATFYAGGDSLLLGPVAPAASFAVRVAGLDGTVRDSIHVPGPGLLSALVSVPGTTRMVAMVIQPPRGLWQVISRDGTITDKLLNSCTCGAVASRDALWMTRAGPTAAEAVVRVALDSATGKFATHQDTIYRGRFSNLSVTADGAQMTVDDGSYTFSVIAASVPDLIKGTLPAGAPLMQASNRVGAYVASATISCERTHAAQRSWRNRRRGEWNHKCRLTIGRGSPRHCFSRRSARWPNASRSPSSRPISSPSTAPEPRQRRW